MRSFMKVSARLITAVLAVASLATAAQAQSSSFTVRVNVPFAFQTSSGQGFQPGVYVITDIGAQTILIRGAKTGGIALVMTKSDDWKRAAQGKAVFTHYGDRYYLHALSMTGSGERLTFATSKQERHLQVAGVTQSNTVELASLQAGH